jgi:hypothetical protein
MRRWTVKTASIAAECENNLDAWSYLVRRGYAWQLGGWHARMAAALIAAGEI